MLYKTLKKYNHKAENGSCFIKFKKMIHVVFFNCFEKIGKHCENEEFYCILSLKYWK